jgi:hypothetical protein
MNTIINFLKDIDTDILSFIISVKAYFLSFIHNMDAGTLATLIFGIIFGIPFIAMIVYAVVLHRRGIKMGVTYDHSRRIQDDDCFGDIVYDPAYSNLPSNIYYNDED